MITALFPEHDRITNLKAIIEELQNQLKEVNENSLWLKPIIEKRIAENTIILNKLQERI